MAQTTMPAAFLGHGSPMNTLEHNRYTEAWRVFGASVPTPRAILAISAHWYINATALTAMEQPRTIHDFFGFPPELFAVEYPAPGAPDVAEEIAASVKPTWVGLDRDSWGIDHGTWSVLVHAFPDADVPVIQLSINATKPHEYHLELGSRLAPLRDQGVLIVGSGNVVHNLGRMDPRLEDQGTDWAHRFNEEAIERMRNDPDSVAGLDTHPDYGLAAPTPEHFIPLLYLAGLARSSGETPQVLVDGYAYGSLSMTSFTLGSTSRAPMEGDGAAPLPGPDEIPPDSTNA